MEVQRDRDGNKEGKELETAIKRETTRHTNDGDGDGDRHE